MIPVKYSPGTQKSPQQTLITQPCFTDTDKVHFPDGRLSTLPAFSTASATSDYVTLLGAVRFIHAQRVTGTYAGTYSILGSNTRLYAVKNSTLFNITPFADQKSESLGNDPISTTNTDATVTITWTAHGLSVGDEVTIANATATGGLTIDGAHTVASVPDADTFTYEASSNASSTATGGGANVVISSIGVADTLGADPISTTSGDAIITVTYTAHGLVAGDRIKIRDSSGVGGINHAEINKELIVATTPTANTFTFEAGANALTTATGGGSVVRIYKQMAAGNIDQGSATGYGVGEYGEGIYGVGGEVRSAQSFPRIWSGDQFGNDFVFCAGDYISGDGQKIYFWDGNTSKAPTVLTNAPTDCNFVSVVNNSVVALRGAQVQICEIGDATVWSGVTTYTSRELSVFKLISCYRYTDKNGVIFTPNRVFLLSYVGGGDIWDLRELFSDDGIIAPNAACILDNLLYWRGYRASYVFDGSPATIVENPQNDEWIIENINLGSAWKCFAYADPQNGEWYFHFPTGASTEPTDYVIHNVKDGSHTLGLMDRTAAQQVPQLDGQFLMANATSASVAGTLFRHFTNGAVTFDWEATTSFSYVDVGQSRGFFRQIFPDSNQAGTCTLNLLTREYPQGTTTTSADYTFNGARKYITTKASGKLLAMKFSGNSRFTLGGWVLNVISRGRR